MRVYKPGKIRDGLWLLGTRESNVYLLEGSSHSMIVSGGMSYIVPDILEQFDTFGIDMDRITKALILHSHFDHVGVIPFFKQQQKKIDIYASSRAWEIFRMPRSIETINRFSRDVASKIGKLNIYDKYDLDWSGEITGKSMSNGDLIDLGDLKTYVYETPGHSSCSISLYVPDFKALFPSDSGGIPYGDTIIVSGNSNYTKFQKSLVKLEKLDIDYYCADHYGYVTGEESKSFITQCKIAAEQFRTFMEIIYSRSKDVETASKVLAERFYKSNKDYFLTTEIMEGVFRQMIRHIAGIK